MVVSGTSNDAREENTIPVARTRVGFDSTRTVTGADVPGMSIALATFVWIKAKRRIHIARSESRLLERCEGVFILTVFMLRPSWIVRF